MDFQIPFYIPPADVRIQHGDRIVLLGSCFSDSIQTHFFRSGIDVLSNSFGTIFHPTILANSIEFALLESKEPRIFQRNDLYFSWDSASAIFGKTEAEVRTKFGEQRAVFADYLRTAKCLLITFGTAWGYRLITSDVSAEMNIQGIVANCHKMPGSLFEKKLGSINEEWQRWHTLILTLKAFNPDLNIIFTVSPVRHKKDGLIENNQSKARLIELVHRIVESTDAHYFPAYEIVIDELRDYRFFKEDRVHPTEEAVQYVWNRFEETYFSPVTRQLSHKIRQIHLACAHKSLHPESEESVQHQQATEARVTELMAEHPEVYLKGLLDD
jgi:hypothetical protein